MNRFKNALLVYFGGAWFAAFAQCNCSSAYPAPAVGETVVYVNPGQGSSGIQSAINAASGPTTIYLMNGTYNVSGGQINIIKPDITIRSFSGNRDSVIIEGAGMLTGSGYHGISILNTHAKVVDLTIKNIDTHPIDINFWYQPNDIDDVVLHNLHIIDGGQQLVKMSYSGTAAQSGNNGVIECCTIEYSSSLPGSNWYTNGIDLHNAHNWIVRDNIIRNIKAGPGTSSDAGPAILFFKGGTNMVIERNQIIDCDEGIFLGNWGDPAGQASTNGGVVRNNFIRGHSNSRCGIGIVRSPNAVVINNTIWSPGGTAWTAEEYSIEVTGSETTNLLLQNNLMDETMWNNQNTAPAFSMVTNIEHAASTEFINCNGANPDLRLSSGASAVDSGTAHSLRTDDADCNGIYGAVDVGADEQVNGTTQTEEMIYAGKVLMYPNPAKEYIILHCIACSLRTIEMYDLSGKLCLRENLNSTQDTYKLNLPVVTSGFYTLKASSGSSDYFFKLFID